MKIDSRRSDVAVSGMLSQRAFTVEAGPHIMAVLSGLYKNPVEAMVREYLTNMYDAYIALRKVDPNATIRPPELHLPSRMDGNLSFTDFGIGMDAEQVMEIYSTYGRTTKGNDNDEVGGFGLGSKTAFCYNGGASWMIVARKNGKENVFTAFIGEDGVPQLTHVSETPTDEHSGVTVSIPIRREDAREIRQAVEKFAPYFPMELKLTGEISDVKVTKPEYHLRSDKWGFQTATGYGMNTARVIMGNVPYPIDNDKFLLEGPDYGNFNNFIRRNRIDLFVDIGAVNIVPSRDSLMYTPLTIRTIQSCLKSLMKEVTEQLEAQIVACKTEWEVVEQLQVLDKMEAASFVPNVKWNGKTISTKAVTRTFADLRKLDPNAMASIYFIDGSRAKIEMEDYTTDEADDVMHMTPGEINKNWLIINDLPKGGAMMARALLHEKCVSKTRTGRTASWGHKRGHAILLTTALTKAQVANFFGGMPVEKLQSVAHLKGTVAVPTSLKVTKDTIYRWSSTSWQARVNVPNGSDTYYYLPLTKNGHRYSYENGHHSQKDTMKYLTDYAGVFGMNVQVVYGMKADDTPKLPKNWINLEEAIKLEVTKQAKKNIRSLALANVGVTAAVTHFNAMIVGAALSKSGVKSIIQFEKDYADITEAVSNKVVKTILAATGKLKLGDTWESLTADVKVPDLEEQRDNIFKRYPMMKVVYEVSNKNYYGYGYDGGRTFKEHEKSVLDYLAAM